MKRGRRYNLLLSREKLEKIEVVEEVLSESNILINELGN